jgi:hypothetical protein
MKDAMNVVSTGATHEFILFAVNRSKDVTP